MAKRDWCVSCKRVRVSAPGKCKACGRRRGKHKPAWTQRGTSKHLSGPKRAAREMIRDTVARRRAEERGNPRGKRRR